MKKSNDSRIDNLEMTKVNMGASLKNLETQMGQLTQSMKQVHQNLFRVIWKRIRKIIWPSLYGVEKRLEMEEDLGIPNML